MAQAADAVAVAGEGPQPSPEDQEPAPKEGLLQTPVPFGPFLSLAAAFIALFQPQLVHWYLS